MNKGAQKSSGKLFEEPASPAEKAGAVYTANIDGAARGNPGPAAYGVVIRKPDGTTQESLGKYIGRHTNNVAEYYALIAALDYAAANGIRRLRVYGDSQLIVNQIKGLYKVKHPDLRPLHERAKKQAATLEFFSIQYVPREQNRDADDMANAALDGAKSAKSAEGSAAAARFAPANTTPHRNPAPAPTPQKAALENVLYLDDMHVGQRFRAGSYEMTTERIKSFAAEFDPQPFHLNEAAGQQSVFRGLAASGWHTAAATMRLIVDAMHLAGGSVGLGGEITWPRPTRPGDTLRLEVEILDVRQSRSKPNQGVVTARCVTFNQNGEQVQVLTTKILSFKRPEKAIASE
jgi:acyl dehydratase/ribonuclease HI